MKKRLISRPARAFFPALTAVYAALFPANAGAALELWAAVLLARACSLCAGAALRRASGAVINDARLRGNFLTAFLLMLAGGAGAVLLSMNFLPIAFWTACAGALINGAQLCCDRLYASPDAFSPGLYDALIALMAVSGLMMSGSGGLLLPLLCLPAALAGCMLLFGMRRGMKLRPGFRVLACAPAAILKNWLFPAAITAGAIFAEADPMLTAAALIGCAVLEWLEPNFRRAEGESSAATIAACLTAIVALGPAAAFPPAVHGALSPDSAAIYTNLTLCALLAAAFGALAVGVAITLRRAAIMLVMLVAIAAALEIQLNITGFDIIPYWRWIMIGIALIIAGLCNSDMHEACIRAKARARRRK